MPCEGESGETKSPGAIFNSEAGPKGEGQDARSQAEFTRQ